MELEIIGDNKIIKYDLNSFEYKESEKVDFSIVRGKKFRSDYFFVRGGSNQPYLTVLQNPSKTEFSFFPNGGPKHTNYPFNSFTEGVNGTLLQINFSNIIYGVDHHKLLTEKFIIDFEGDEFDQKVVDQMTSPSQIKNEMANHKIVTKYFYDLGDKLYFTYVFQNKYFVAIKSLKNDADELVYEITKGKNDVTNEEFPPYILNQNGKDLIAIKSLESDATEVEHDFEIFILNVKKDVFK